MAIPINKEEFEAILNELCIDNEKRTPISKSNVMKYLEVLSDEMIRAIQQFGMSKDVQFISLVLVEHFLDKVYEYYSKRLVKENVKDILEEVKQQAVIQVFTCIMIASKYDSSQSYLPPSDVCKCVQFMGRKCEIKDILTCELFILQHLKGDFSPNDNPLVYIHWIIQILLFNDPHLEAEQLLQVSREILEQIYPHRKALYERLYKCLTGNISVLTEHIESVHDLVYNYMYLASGVITAAATSLRNMTCDLGVFMHQMHQLCKIKTSHIAALAYVILNVLSPENISSLNHQ